MIFSTSDTPNINNASIAFVSVFNDLNNNISINSILKNIDSVAISYFEKKDEQDVYISQKTDSLFSYQIFEKIIDKRINYIESLTYLPEKWISGKSKKPSHDIIKKASKLLNYSRFYFSRKRLEKLPTLIMGPIPSGGICIEFHINIENALYFSLFNDMKLEIEIKKGNYYSVVETVENKYIAKIMESYDALAE